MRNEIRQSRGLTLIEALITLLVVAFGLLGFATLQSRMRVHSDLSKQRSEAVRLAQENMENLRAFGTLAVDASVANNFAYNTGVVDGASAKTVLAASVTTSTNTTYTLNQTVASSSQAGMKELTLNVSWVDRDNSTQQVTLKSFVAGVEPRLAAALAIPPNGSPVKDPLGRSVRVPLPAKDLGNGTSVFKPNSAGTLAFLFDNKTANVTSKCTAVPVTVTTAQITVAAMAGYSCTSIDGLLLSGYVRFSVGNSPDAATPNDATKPLSIRVDLDDAAPSPGSVGTVAQLNAANWPTAAQAVQTMSYAAPECASQESKTVTFTTPVSYSQINNSVVQSISSTGVIVVVPVTVANTAAALAPYVDLAAANVISPTDTGERFVVYTCVVYPKVFSGTKAWTGRTLIIPSGWTVGTTAATFKVCRYSADDNLNGYVWTTSGSNVVKIDNSEHPYAYLFASSAVNNQNFLVIKGSKACPTDGPVEVNGQGAENYTDETTVTHQTS